MGTVHCTTYIFEIGIELQIVVDRGRGRIFRGWKDNVLVIKHRPRYHEEDLFKISTNCISDVQNGKVGDKVLGDCVI